MRIREARIDESQEIRKLILEAVSPHKDVDFNSAGWERFLEPNSEGAIRDRLISQYYLTLLCESNGQLAGLITIKNYERIDQLFVHPLFRRQGIARQLWESARDMCEMDFATKEFRVKSSSMGVPVYESFGFRLTGAKVSNNGMSYYPMALSAQAEVNK